MAVSSKHLFKIFNLTEVAPPIMFRSLKEVRNSKEMQPFAHHVARAWEALDLDGVYCSNGRPTVYFKKVERVDSNEINRLHRLFWNQGIATILVVASPNDVAILSAMAKPASPGGKLEDGNRLVSMLSQSADAMALAKFIEQLETGHFYKTYRDCFDQTAVVDQYLVNNLLILADTLAVSQSHSRLATDSFLCCLIFACYLVDRGVIGERQIAKAGAEGIGNIRDLLNQYAPHDASRVLTKLFKQLREDFNGSLFDDPLLCFDSLITSDNVQLLRRFFNGDELGSGQRSLGFWAYDFNLIPIEMVSTIYEELLARTNAEEKKKTGAFYTPVVLAEMVVDMALEGENDLSGKRFLDPSCGSGTFLALLFSRLANEWERYHPDAANFEKATALIDILRTQIAGLDINETACRITCFSLYLAFLDRLDPKEVDQLKAQGKVLPKLLFGGSENVFENGGGVYHGNFFNIEETGTKFDLIVGNPPWSSRRFDEAADLWCKANQMVPGIKTKDRQKVFMPNKEIAHGFMWKAACHLGEAGKTCLLLPTKILTNKSSAFQERWLQRFTAEKIVMLSDWRRILFEKAITPTMIVRWNKLFPKSDYPIDFQTPKVTRLDPRRGVIPIYPGDRKTVRWRDILDQAKAGRAPVFWKKRFGGRRRDVEFLGFLENYPTLGDLTGTPAMPKRWIVGPGFEPFRQNRTTGKPKEIWWTSDHLYIEARTKGLKWVLSKKQCQPVSKEIRSLRRSPSQDLFQPPLVLISQGTTKVVYCDFPVLFQRAFQSISGPPEDSYIFRFLSVFLQSRLAQYILFHTSVNIGSERNKALQFELMRLPFFLPEAAFNPERAKAILYEASDEVDAFAKKQELLFGESDAVALEEKFNRLIYEYYDLTERQVLLIEDTLDVFQESMTPPNMWKEVPTLSMPDRKQRQTFVTRLCDTLNAWTQRSGLKISGEVFVSQSSGLGLVRLIKGNAQLPYEEHNQENAMASALEKLYQSASNIRGRWDHLRDIKVFDPQYLYMVKPLELRFWTPGTALEDADEIMAAILSAGRAS